MEYQKGFKYQLTKPEKIFTGIFPLEDIETPFLLLKTDGWLYIAYGYAWDGPSGPMVDTPSLMLPSLVHDALYQLMRLGLLLHSYWPQVDALFIQLAKDRKVWALRRWYALRGLRLANGTCADPKNARKTYILD